MEAVGPLFIYLCDQIPHILSPFPSVPFVSSLILAFWMVSVRSAGLALNRRGACFSSAGHVRGNGLATLRPATPACCRTVRSVLLSSATQKSVTHKARWEDVHTSGPVQVAKPCLHTPEQAVPTLSALIVVDTSASAACVKDAWGK